MRRERGPPVALGGNVMVPTTFSITLVDEIYIVLWTGMSPAMVLPTRARTRIT